MAGTSSTIDMVKSLGRFRYPGTNSFGHQWEKLNVLSRASYSSVKVPLLVVRVYRGSRGPTLRPQDIQPLGRRNGEINCDGTAKESWEEDISRPAAGTSHVIRALGQEQANWNQGKIFMEPPYFQEIK